MYDIPEELNYQRWPTLLGGSCAVPDNLGRGGVERYIYQEDGRQYQTLDIILLTASPSIE